MTIPKYRWVKGQYKHCCTRPLLVGRKLYLVFGFNLMLLMSALGTGSVTITCYNLGSGPIGVQGILLGYNEDASGGGTYYPYSISYVPPSTTIPQGGNYVYTWTSPAGPGHTYYIAGNYQPVSGGAATFSGEQSAASGSAVSISLFFYPNNVTNAVYTNYQFTVYNTTAANGTALFYFDGALMQSTPLAPGQAAGYVTPPVEVLPTPQNFTVKAQFVPGSTTITQDSNGNPTFTAGGSGSATTTGSGGSSSTTTSGASSTSSGGTNVVTPLNNQETPANTNAIIYNSPTGSASESTLEAVGNQIHIDLGNVISGESALNNTMLQWEYTQTNQLGQVITYLAQASNNDGAIQIVGAITNLQAHMSNNVVVNVLTTNSSGTTLTNYALASNQTNTWTWLGAISNELSNIISGTNGSNGTNLLSIDSSSIMTAANSASAAAQTSLANLQTAVSGIPDGSDTPAGTEPVAIIAAGTSLTGVQNFTIAPTRGVWANLWALLKRLSTYILVAFYCRMIITDVIKLVQWMTSAAGRQVPNFNFEVLGNGGNIAGVTMFIGITVLVLFLYAAALALTFTGLFTGFNIAGAISAIGGNPFNYMDGGALYWLEMAFPVGFCMGLISAYLTWLISLAGVRIIYGFAIQLFPK